MINLIRRLFSEIRALTASAKRKIGSLNVALILTLVLGLVIGVGSYFAVDITSRIVIEGVYMQESEKRERADEYAAQLQRYVDRYGVTARNSAPAFTYFMQENEYVRLIVSTGDDAAEFDGGSGDGGAYLYNVNMADGETLDVIISDTSEDFYYRMFEIIKLVAGVVALFAVMIVYVQRLTARISKLSREVGMVSGGDTARHVNMPGHDEITELSQSVEQMRVSILTKIENEKAALDANSELIKAMSHDIRTPLTVLLGYIDMMKERAEGDPAMMEYVTSSEKTAMRLKRLSDDMFGYFLLFGNGQDNVKLDAYNLGFLAEQMLSEFVFLLHERDYRVTLDIADEARGAEIKTDPDMLMRIIENLLSNMFKYADRDGEITVRVSCDGEIGKLIFTNRVYRGENKVETNGIGLKSCRKIADTLGMGFEVLECGDVYTTEITAPVVKPAV